ncbi:unnamed protein product [Aspergillus oryzae]|nr:unnamed protein product [Aspergillus oryzae]GMF89361.1 unnamed protein product [Aspergillus oryzae]GMG11077.1 unnamed protein product [Aspergillus oryzae]GMG35248.1 unnamed protein product [Aspergillus oryzae]GMG53501.1 unnamed protein product [Aspergillus oryzae var. brunneus]
MLFVRKSYFLPTFILVFLTYILFSNLPPGAEIPYIDDPAEYGPPPPRPPPKGNDLIHYRNPTEKHPVEEYIPLPTAAPSPIPRVQYEFPVESWFTRRRRVKKQNAVRNAFKHAWKGYKEHAWLRDELSPLSAEYRESFGGWAATLVDSLDTLIIMGLMDEFEDALQAIEHIDFSTTGATQINVFETNIRYLGGFLGAYDLTNGSYPILLKKAVEVADLIYGSFDTRNRMPQSRWEWTR